MILETFYEDGLIDYKYKVTQMNFNELRSIDRIYFLYILACSVFTKPNEINTRFSNVLFF